LHAFVVTQLRTLRLSAKREALAGGESSGGLMFIAAISTGISALILVLGVYVAVVFKKRLQGLEAELKKAQFDLSKANVNLSALMHQVEQLSLAAPAVAPKTSLPERNPEPAKAHATSFKMHRSK
jgi:phosphomannomutase